MSAKSNYRFCIVAFFLFAIWPSASRAITIDELAEICEKMESSIADISLEYNWFVVPPLTIDEIGKEMETSPLAVKEGFYAYKLSAAGLCPKNPKDESPEQFLFEETANVIDKEGRSWEDTTKKSYNKETGGKYLQISKLPKAVPDGVISADKPDVYPTPIKFFSVLHTRLSKVTDNKPLSVLLKQYKELVRLDNNIKKVNDFNTIHVELLQEWTKQVCMRIYFSVDHGYTPVRYEYIRNTAAGVVEVNVAMDVYSLEQVAEGLWFPNSGSISTSDSERVNMYVATSKIIVNRGLTDKQFDIEFPEGARVYDKINDRDYVVKSASD